MQIKTGYQNSFRVVNPLCSRHELLISLRNTWPNYDVIDVDIRFMISF